MLPSDRMKGKIKQFERADGYGEVLEVVRGLAEPRHYCAHLDGDGLPTERIVEGIRGLLSERHPGVSRRRRWIEAAIWQRAHEGEGVSP